MIVYNQALSDVIMDILDRLSLRGFTQWGEGVIGRGSHRGEPHYGNHTWPAKNVATMVVCESESARALLERLRALDADTTEQGTRAFVWSIEDGM